MAQLLDGSMSPREIRARYPQTAALLESFGFPALCDDCPIEVVARRAGQPANEVLEALNSLVFGHSSLPDEADREEAAREEEFWSLV